MNFATPKFSGNVTFSTKINTILPANQFGGSSGLRFELPVTNNKKVSISYDIYFPIDFDPVFGGKVFGGINGPEFCTRNMFRRNLSDSSKFGGEIYVHGPKQLDPNYNSIPGFKSSTGDSLFQYYFTFNKGSFNSIKLSVQLNDPGKANGIISCTINNVTKTYSRYTFITKKESVITSALFQTFYGGDNISYAPKKAFEIKIENIKIEN